MQFEPFLIEGRIIKRYKRFFADIELLNGEVITAHCPNTGSMKQCLFPGHPAWVSPANNPKRKLQYTWEFAQLPNGDQVGINTHRANQLCADAIRSEQIPELAGYEKLKPEVKYGEENSRIDLLLETPSNPKFPERCFVEVKNVTLGPAEAGDSTVGYFPDAVTTRGQKHLRELMSIAQQGERAVLLFCVQHSGIKEVRPADHIDEEYGQLIRQAFDRGVEIMAWRVALSAREFCVTEEVPVVL